MVVLPSIGVVIVGDKNFLLYLFMSIIGLLLVLWSYRTEQKKLTVLQIVFLVGWSMSLIASIIGILLTK